MNPTAIDDFAPFSEACGADRLHLDIAGADGRAGSRRAFDQPFLVVGRSPDADLRLDHEEVSWRHCYLQLIGGRLVAIDLDSRAGVRIDGDAQRTGWVGPGNALQVGPIGLRLGGGVAEGHGDDRGQPDWVHPLSAQYARGLPAAAMEIEGPASQTYGWRMSRALALIGRSAACQVRLMDSSVSKFHAALVRTPGGVWLVDLLSREGIRVDGAGVRAARLEEGAECQVGPFTLRLRRETAAPSPPRRPAASRSLPPPAGPPASSPERPSVLIAAPGGSPTPLAVKSEWVAGPAGEPALRGEPVAEAFSSQQAMMMLAQMLGTMHSDHMNLVRDELAEIRRLAEEMHALRVEIGRRPAEAPAPAPTALPSFPGPPSHGAAPALPGGEPMPEMGRALPRDPRECLAIASDFLAAYERKQNGYWNRVLRLVKGLSQSPDPARGPLGPAPLG